MSKKNQKNKKKKHKKHSFLKNTRYEDLTSAHAQHQIIHPIKN